jgi:hypothetical protein
VTREGGRPSEDANINCQVYVNEIAETEINLCRPILVTLLEIKEIQRTNIFNNT